MDGTQQLLRCFEYQICNDVGEVIEIGSCIGFSPGNAKAMLAVERVGIKTINIIVKEVINPVQLSFDFEKSGGCHGI